MKLLTVLRLSFISKSPILCGLDPVSRCSYVSYVSQLAHVERGAQNHPIQPGTSARYLQQKKCQHLCLQRVKVVRAAMYAEQPSSIFGAALQSKPGSMRSHSRRIACCPHLLKRCTQEGASCLGSHDWSKQSTPQIWHLFKTLPVQSANVFRSRRNRPKSVSREVHSIATGGQRKSCHLSRMDQPYSRHVHCLVTASWHRL